VVYFATWDYMASVYAPWLPHMGKCAGHPYAALSGCLILSSYLLLFIMFYIESYKKPGAGKNTGGQSKTQRVPKDANGGVHESQRAKRLS
jgi:hypothetical protein